ADRPGQLGNRLLANESSQWLAIRADQYKSGPRHRMPRFPQLQMRIHDHWMTDVILLYEILQSLSCLRIGELRRIHTNNDQPFPEALGQFFLDRKHVDTIDAAGREEIEQNRPALQIIP